MDTKIKINNGEKEFELDINSNEVNEESTYENFMEMWNETMVKPIMERRKKQLKNFGRKLSVNRNKLLLI